MFAYASALSALAAAANGTVGETAVAASEGGVREGEGVAQAGQAAPLGQGEGVAQAGQAAPLGLVHPGPVRDPARKSLLWLRRAAAAGRCDGLVLGMGIGTDRYRG